MRLPDTAHTARPWRIHELAPDFRLEDVWRLPIVGGRDDFPRLVRLFASHDLSRTPSAAVRTLVAIRSKVGALFGWDHPALGAPRGGPTVRDRLPADLRDGESGPVFDSLPFTSLYLLENEWSAEAANATMHGILHLGWIPDDDGTFHGQMAILVKPNGLLGRAYMGAIKPFRHAIVYPALLRMMEQKWRAAPHRGG